MNENLIVSLKDIVVEFDGQKVLDGLSLDIHDKEFVTFLGPSGCGKTTTLRVIAGFVTPKSGNVFFDGKDIANMPPYKRPVNTVFQKYALFPHLNVFENVAFGLRLKKMTEDEIRPKVLEMLEIVGLKGFERRSIYQLSGGQQQRVAIARSLVNQPRVLLLDEPLGALDLKLRKDMQIELKRIQQRTGITFIYVTHDQEEALTLSDRIAVFNKGIIEQIGTPNEVYNHSQTEFVCNFIGDINRLNDDTVSALRAAGAEVDASKHNYIRLERLHVNVAPRGGEIALDGTVESCEYYGLYIKYYIHVGTQSLKVIEKNDGVNIYDPGQRVKVILNPNDIMAYAPSAEEVE